MGKYARGKRSLALSDRGGLRVKYTDLKTTWDGLRVSPEDWEPKHPQLTPAKNVVDATALFNPRQDNDPENVTFFVGYNYDIFLDPRQRPPVGVPGKGSIGAIPRSSLEYEITVTGVAGTGAVNDIAAIGTNSGSVAATGALGDYTPESEITETGLAGDGEAGTAVPNIVIDVTITNGVAGTAALGDADTGTTPLNDATFGTGAVGTSTLQQEAKPTGVAGTGAVQALGNDSPIALIEETGVAGTGAVHVIGESGNSEFRVNVTGVAGLAGVGRTGIEEAVSEIIETGLAGTGAVGDGNAEQVAVGFGNDSWGNGTWGYGT